jgi:hypothetical protein
MLHKSMTIVTENNRFVYSLRIFEHKFEFKPSPPYIPLSVIFQRVANRLQGTRFFSDWLENCGEGGVGGWGAGGGGKG